MGSTGHSVPSSPTTKHSLAETPGPALCLTGPQSCHLGSGWGSQISRGGPSTTYSWRSLFYDPGLPPQSQFSQFSLCQEGKLRPSGSL